jgi:hypothetical protein
LTTRSGIVESLNKSTITAFKAGGKIIIGTRTVIGGTYGNRKYKKDGSDYIEKESKTRVDGSLRSQEAIKLIVETNAQMESKLTLPVNKAKWDKLRECISKKIIQFEEHRVAVN